MAARFVNVDHDTPLLLPPDLRDWVPPDHMVHFIMEAVSLLDLRAARVNERGSGSEQYPPSMMLGLLIYSDTSGTFSSRKIEKNTYEQVAVRLLCADHHPDHDSICAFRRGNRELLASSFHQVLEMAARLQVLRVGEVTLAIDGTKILANASRHSAVSYGHAVGQMELLEEQITQLLQKAEQADSTPLEDGLSVPEEVARREQRMEKLREAAAQIQARARERQREQMATYTERQDQREAQKAAGKKPKGRNRRPPGAEPASRDQYNFTDPQSRMMKTTVGFEQSCNAQAAVEVESRLLVASEVSDAPNDKAQLVPTLAATSRVVQSIKAVLVDSGFYSIPAVETVERGSPEQSGPCVYAAVGRQQHGRSIEALEKHADPPTPGPEASAVEVMAHRLQTKAGRELYALRKQTIEPVFGIIKAAMGFRRFSLRGLDHVRTEWTLVTLAYNLKRLFHLGTNLRVA
jgi:transposase